jgi:hypothetical protein
MDTYDLTEEEELSLPLPLEWELVPPKNEDDFPVFVNSTTNEEVMEHPVITEARCPPDLAYFMRKMQALNSACD